MKTRRKAKPDWAKLDGFPARLRWAIDNKEEYASPWSVGSELRSMGLVENETYLFRYLTDGDGNLKADVGARPTPEVMDYLALALEVDRRWLDKGTGEPFTDQRERQAEVSKIEAEVRSQKRFSRGQRLDLIRTQMEADGVREVHHRMIVAMDQHPEFNTGQKIIDALKTLNVRGGPSTNFYLYGQYVPKRPYIEAFATLLDVNPDWLESGQGKMYLNGKPAEKPKEEETEESSPIAVDKLREDSPLHPKNRRVKPKPEPEQAPKPVSRIEADEKWLARIDTDLGALTTRVEELERMQDLRLNGMAKKIDAILEWAECMAKIQRGPVVD